MRKLLILFVTVITFSFMLTSMKLYTYRRNNPPLSVCKKIDVKEKGLISYWSFDDIKGLIAKDNLSYGFDGRIKNITGLTLPIDFIKPTEGKYDNALEFNGLGWISAGNNSIFSSEKFTISLWAYINKEGGVPTLMAKSSWPCYDGWWLCTKPETRYIDFAVAWGDEMIHIESGFELPLQEWHHIAVTVDNQEHIIKFFVDGILYGDPHNNIPEWKSNWNHDLFIGDYDGSGRWPWLGRIDEIYFFNTVLPSEEIKHLYDNEYKFL